jgi:hypothetical protein
VQVKKADGDPQLLRTGNIVTYDSVAYYATFTPVAEATLPRGYVIPAGFEALVQNLKNHGVEVTQLSKPQTYSGEVFNVTALTLSQRKFEGHFMATAQGNFAAATKKFKKGDYVVDLAQPLANLIFYLLEPQSDDGLVTWNFFDAYLEKAGVKTKPVAYPVFKYF